MPIADRSLITFPHEIADSDSAVERPLEGRESSSRKSRASASVGVASPLQGRGMRRNVLPKLLGGLNTSNLIHRWINFYPPFLGAGIRVRHIAADMKAFDVEMKLRWWNANYVGTQFGGSLFSMTDPFYMLMVLANLGSDYVVWDKAATIRYRKPGKGTVRAEFRLTDAQLDDIRDKLKTLPKYDAIFNVEVKDEQGIVIADVEKILHVRKKERTQRGT